MKGRLGALRHAKNKKSLSILLQNQTQCPICLENYDLLKKVPLMICLNQHSACEDCLATIYSRPKCPICDEALIPRKSIKKNRIVCCLIEQMIKFGGETIIECAKFKYKGTTKKGKPDGKGEQIRRNGHSYKGEFKDGELSGQCHVLTKHGASFYGEASKGTLTGVFTTMFGSTIEGSFNLDTLEGTQCKKKYTNGDIFIGNVKELKAEGFGKIRFNNGNTFQGNFYKDYISDNGKGTISGTFPIEIINGSIHVQQIEEQIVVAENHSHYDNFQRRYDQSSGSNSSDS